MSSFDVLSLFNHHTDESHNICINICKHDAETFVSLAYIALQYMGPFGLSIVDLNTGSGIMHGTCQRSIINTHTDQQSIFLAFAVGLNVFRNRHFKLKSLTYLNLMLIIFDRSFQMKLILFLNEV